jgi:hypothetical protein
MWIMPNSFKNTSVERVEYYPRNTSNEGTSSQEKNFFQGSLNVLLFTHTFSE